MVPVSSVIQVLRVVNEDVVEETRREPRAYIIRILTEKQTFEYGTSLKSDAERWTKALNVALDVVTWRNFFNSFAEESKRRPDDSMSGYMSRKESKSGKCQRFWFYLRNQMLFAFDNDIDRNFLEKIDLKKMIEISEAAVSYRCCPYYFQLVFPDKKVYQFCLESKRQLEAWIIALKGTKVFGIDPLKLPVTEETGIRLPKITVRLLSYVEKHCISFPNLYAYNLSDEEYAVQCSLKNYLNRGNQLDDFVNFESLGYIIPDLAKVLFMELPESLVPRGCHEEFYRLVSATGNEVSDAHLNQALSKVSTPILRILIFMIEHFAKVVANKESNNMDWATISRIWGSILIHGMNPEMAQRVLLVFCSRIDVLQQYVNADSNALAMAKMKLAYETTERSVDVWFDENLSPLRIHKVTWLTTCKQIIEKLKSTLEFKTDINYLLFEERDVYYRPILNQEIILQIVKDRVAKLWWKPTWLNFSSGSEEFSGWLFKEGGSIKSWKKRYFKLDRHGLHYYKDPSLKNHVGTITIENKELYFLKTYPKSPTLFPMCLKDTTGCTDSVPRFLAAESEESRCEWIDNFYYLKTNACKSK